MNNQQMKSSFERIKQLSDENTLLREENNRLKESSLSLNQSFKILLDQNIERFDDLRKKNDAKMSEIYEAFDNTITNVINRNEYLNSSFKKILEDFVNISCGVYRSKISLLLKDNEELTNRCNHFNNEKEELNNKINNLIAELKNKEYELSIFTKNMINSDIIEQKFQCSEADKQKLKEMLESTSLELVTLKEKYHKEVNEHESLKNEINIIKKELETTKGLFSTERDKNISAFNEIYNKDQIIKTLRYENRSLNSQNEDLNMKVDSLNESLETLMKEYQRTLQQLDNYKIEVAHAKSDVEVSQIEKNSIVNEKKILENEILELREKLSNTEFSISERIKEIQTISLKEKEDLKSKYEKNILQLEKENNAKLVKYASDNKANVADFERKINTYMTQLRSSSDCIASLTEENIKQKELYERAKNDIQSIDGRIIEIQSRHKLEIEDIKRAHSKEKEDIIISAKNAEEKIRKEMKELYANKEESHANLLECKNVINKLETNIKNLKITLEQKSAAYIELQTLSNNIVNEKSMLKNENTKLLSESKKKETTIEDLKNQNKALTQKLLSLKKNSNENSINNSQHSNNSQPMPVSFEKLSYLPDTKNFRMNNNNNQDSIEIQMENNNGSIKSNTYSSLGIGSLANSPINSSIALNLNG